MFDGRIFTIVLYRVCISQSAGKFYNSPDHNLQIAHSTSTLKLKILFSASDVDGFFPDIDDVFVCILCFP